jgi:ATP-dependent helicase YprA (DUF1998 family)
MKIKEFKLKRYTVNELNHNIKLYKHQKEIFEQFNNTTRNFLLLTATGSGKTIASLLPSKIDK